MSRIPLVDPEDAPPEVAALYEKIRAMDSPVMNVVRLFGNHAGFLRGFVEMLEPLYGSPSLAPRYRELAYLRASQLNSCHY